MKVIYLHHPYNPEQIVNEDTVLTLGFFDGVHRGHQAVIAQAKKIADQKHMKLALMTFNHHPALVFKQVGPQGILYLSPIPRKIELMAQQGVDILYIVEFTSHFANLSPQAFVDQYVVGLHAKVAVGGFDYTFGAHADADITTMPDYAKGRFEVVTVGKLAHSSEKISSSLIRELMAQGNVDLVNTMLGYTYQTDGLVVHGLARGRTLNYPTANIFNESQQKIPGIGVYSVKIEVNGTWYPAMASVGYNVTFGDSKYATVEINIFDFSDYIYGEKVKVRWYHRLRGEVKFNGADELVAQLNRDKVDTQQYFATLAKD